MKILSIALLVSVASVSAALAGEKQAAPFVVQEQGKGFTRLAEAVQAIGDGDGPIIIAPGTYRQCVVQTSGRVAFKAQQQGPVIFDGAHSEGNAALALLGRPAAVAGHALHNKRVPD